MDYVAPCSHCGEEKPVCCDSGNKFNPKLGKRVHTDPFCVDCCPNTKDEAQRERIRAHIYGETPMTRAEKRKKLEELRAEIARVEATPTIKRKFKLGERVMGGRGHENDKAVVLTREAVEDAMRFYTTPDSRDRVVYLYLPEGRAGVAEMTWIHRHRLEELNS